MMIRDYKQTFMELYDQGLNDTEIGEALGFSPSSISGYRRGLGLPDNLRRVKNYKSRFMELYGNGLSDGDIGKEMGFLRQTIGKFRRSLGLPAHFKFVGRYPMDDGEKQRIRELHGQGLPINKIAEEIGRNSLTVLKFCKRENLDHSRARGKGYVKQRHGENVVDYLKEHGPTPQSTLSTNLAIPYGHFSRMARELFDQIERFKFKVGSSRGRGGIKYGAYSIYGDLNIQEMGNIFSLRDDTRIVDFVAKRISFKIKTIQDARTLVLHLKKQLGTERAKDVVKRLGYVYSKDRRDIHARTRKKFTDQQLLDLYEQRLNDREIAEKFGVSTASVNYRRNKLRLPVIRKRRDPYPLDGLDQIERLNETR